jgi:hypothetical protein
MNQDPFQQPPSQPQQRLPQLADAPTPKSLPAFHDNFSGYEHELALPAHAMRRRRPGARKLTRIILFVLILLALAILIAMRVRTSDVENATHQAEIFVAEMQSNQPDAAYDMGNDAFRKATTEEDLGVMFDKAEPFLVKARIDLVDTYYATSLKGDPRTILVFTAVSGDHTTYIRLVMERQNGVWKAHSLLTQSTPLQAKPE